MEWISVKDRFPEEDIQVLVCVDFDQYNVASYSPSGKSYGGYKVGDWIYQICTCCDSIDDPTHWMPLPEKPEEENLENDCALNCNNVDCQYYPDTCDIHEKICSLYVKCSNHNMT